MDKQAVEASQELTGPVEIDPSLLELISGGGEGGSGDDGPPPPAPKGTW